MATKTKAQLQDELDSVRAELDDVRRTWKGHEQALYKVINDLRAQLQREQGAAARLRIGTPNGKV